MRRIAGTLLALTTVVTLAACGGGGKSASSTNSPIPATSSSVSSSTSSLSLNSNAGDFCKQIVDSKAENIGEDPNGAKQALAVLRQVSPPDEIKDDWNDYLDALQELSQADQNDRVALGRVAANHAKSLSSVSLYISKSCLSLGNSDLSSLSDSLSSFSDSLSSTGN